MSATCIVLLATVVTTSLVALSPNTIMATPTIGCQKVGFTRLISIPDCVQLEITTNACRGKCRSFAVPTTHRFANNSGVISSSGAFDTDVMELLNLLPHSQKQQQQQQQSVTSVGQCCNMLVSEDVEAIANCLDGPRYLLFKSAVECQCYQCKKV